MKLNRRTFLRGSLLGTAGVSIALPLLDAMLDDTASALADGTPLPRRFGVVHWGNGILHSSWVPKEVGPGFALPASFSAFSAPELRPYLTLVTGTNHRFSTPGHIPARGIALSSSHDTVYVAASNAPGYRGQNHPEPTLDVIVREALRGQASGRDSIHLAVTRSNPYFGNSSWGPGGRTFNTPESSPVALFDALFGAVPSDPSDPREQALLRLGAALQVSMLDAVSEQARALQSRLGATDRRRMEAHLEGLRNLERRAQSLVDAGGVIDSGCSAPPAPGEVGGSQRAKAEVMNELLATALACDITRVFSYEYSANQSNFVYGELGINGSHHDDISHQLSSRGGDMTRIVGLVVGGVADLAERLRQKTEGTGNVLDNTLILGTSEHANANQHNWTDHPFFLVGKAGGRIRAGQHYRHPNPGSNYDAPRVLLTAVRAVGVPLERLGQPEVKDSRGSTLPSRQVTESLSELEA
jgi:hypothetical protein